MSTYYLFSITGGTSSYIGSATDTSTTVDNEADQYRVRYWMNGSPTDATCDAGDPAPPATFTCSVTNTTLSWDDTGAAAYYLFSITGGNVHLHR